MGSISVWGGRGVFSHLIPFTVKTKTVSCGPVVIGLHREVTVLQR